MNRYRHVKEAVLAADQKFDSVLDVGCRDSVLKGYLDANVQYVGLDLRQNIGGTVDVINTLEQGLPFKDAAFDCVVALECLEHLNDLQAGTVELMRVARKAVMISLPNMAYVNHRTSFFVRGRFASNKYSLRYDACSATQDRHRWVTVLPETDTFMRQLAGDAGAKLEIARIYGSRKRSFYGLIGKLFRLPPSWWVPGSLYVVTKAIFT